MSAATAQSSLHKLGPSLPCRLPVGPGRRWFATAQPDHQTLIGAARDGLNQLRPRCEPPTRLPLSTGDGPSMAWAKKAFSMPGSCA